MTIHLTSAIHFWFWFPLLLVALVFGAWWGYYRTTPELTRIQRWGLSLLRGIALMLIVLAWAGVELTLQRHFSRQFQLGVILDGSESMVLSDRLGSRRETVSRIINMLSRKPISGSTIVADTIKQSNDLEKMWSSSWSPASYSSASRMLHSLDSLETKPDGLLWITDGAVDEGDAIPYPSKPVWSVPIGDTLPAPNAFIGDPDVPMRAIAGKPMLVTIPVSAEGLAGRDASLELSINGGTTTNRNIKLPEDGTRDTISMTVKPGTAGWRNLTVTLHAPGDSSLSDNKRTIPVFVRVAQLPVTIVYGALHPDVGTIRHSLEADSGFTVSILSEEKATQPPSNGIVFLVHAPHEGTSAGDVVARWAEAYPRGLLWLPGSAGWSPTLSRAFTVSDLKYRGGGDIQSVTPIPTKEHVLLGSTNEPDWSRLPPIAGRRGTFSASANVVSSFLGTEPAIIMQSGATNRTAIFVWDVWRWQQAPLETGRPASIDKFWRAIAEFLGSDRSKTFRAVPDQRYSVGIPCNVSAIWLSPSGETISGGVVTVEVGTQKILLEEREPGNYRGQWQPGHDGNQTLVFRGTTSDGHSDSDTLQVDVDRFSSERQHAISFPRRLAGASITGGGLVHENEIPHLLDSLSSIKVEDYNEHSFILWRSLFSLIGLLLVLSVEWFWRSRIGLL